MTYFEYLEEVRRQAKANPGWRRGQTYFKVLEKIRPDISNKVCGTDIDPYHNDGCLDEFCVFVLENW